MNTIGNLALKQVTDPKHEMMMEYLSAEDGYCLKNVDTIIVDNRNYKVSTTTYDISGKQVHRKRRNFIIY